MDKYRIRQGEELDVRKLDPDDHSAWEGSKEEGKQRLVELRKELAGLQELLYAEGKHRVLVVLQAMDTGGKDGTIRSVFEGVNPQGVRVASFKAPTPIELAHDYLWRIHPQVPGKGELVVFNRSHYEDVLVVRVHNLAPRPVWRRRYRHIVDFERMLADEGVTILKFFLHISADEQKKRLLERIEKPEKRWKFNPGDLEERKLWDTYMNAYSEALRRTSTKSAPWYAVPANSNWYRNLVVLSVLVDQLKKLKMKYPSPVENITQYRPALGVADARPAEEASADA